MEHGVTAAHLEIAGDRASTLRGDHPLPGNAAPLVIAVSPAITVCPVSVVTAAPRDQGCSTLWKITPGTNALTVENLATGLRTAHSRTRGRTEPAGSATQRVLTPLMPTPATKASTSTSPRIPPHQRRKTKCLSCPGCTKREEEEEVTASIHRR